MAKARPGEYCDCGCGEILTGKQRRFIDHNHQMKWWRGQAKTSQPELRNSDEIQARQVDVTLTVTVVFRVKWLEWLDDGLINKPIREKIASAIGALLRHTYHDCLILAVKVDKKQG